MPLTTTYKFGDVVLVPFPFSDQTATKKRPAVVVSSAAYHRKRRDLILMAVRSHVRPSAIATRDEIVVHSWKEAGLIKPSVIKPTLTTVERGLVIRKLGKLDEADQHALKDVLTAIIRG